MDKNDLIIPFGRAVRVNNFKIWRGNYALEAGGKTPVECIYISTVDGAWMTRVPATSQMFSTIVQGYATTDQRLKENFLGMIFTNIYNVGTIPSVALHDAFHFLTEMMTFPYLLLPEKEMEKRMAKSLKADGMDSRKAKEHIAKMIDYRRKLYELIEKKKAQFIEDYEQQQAERRAQEPETQKQLEEDEIAEQAVGIINGEDAS